jgi:hypothetical protein
VERGSALKWLAFQSRVEALRQRVPGARSDSIRGLGEQQVLEELHVGLRGVDTSVVRVEDRPGRRSPLTGRGVEGVFEKVGADVVGHRPAGQLARAQVITGARSRVLPSAIGLTR